MAPFQKLNPKTNGNFWFNPNDFADPPLGQFNNGTQRTICCGPGLNDWDFSVHKKIPLTESTYLQFQAEFFNIFNHTEFRQSGRAFLRWPDRVRQDYRDFGRSARNTIGSEAILLRKAPGRRTRRPGTI